MVRRLWLRCLGRLANVRRKIILLLSFFSFDTLSLLLGALTLYTAIFCFAFELRTTAYDTLWRALLGLVFGATFFTFLLNDFLLFYISFEFILCPMFLLIFIFGSRGRKLHAAYMFFFYTFLSSVLLLFVFTFVLLSESDLRVLVGDVDLQFVCLVLAFLGFAAKVPIYPAHIWLPEAHVEAPMIGSVILASLLLKLGGYGILRFIVGGGFLVIDFLFYACTLICLVSAIYAAVVAVRLIDTKKIIAYSSISHMNVSMVALFSNSLIGYVGLVYSFISHALIAGLLFLYAGFLYERVHTRNLYYYGGFFLSRPLFGTLLLLSLLANLGFPFFCHFIAELFIYIGVVGYSLGAVLLLSISFIFVAVFVFMFLSRVLYSQPTFFSYVPSFGLAEQLGVVGNLGGVILLGVMPFLLVDLTLWSFADFDMCCNLVLWNFRSFVLFSGFLPGLLGSLILVFIIASIGFLFVNFNVIYMLICVELLFMVINTGFVFTSVLHNDLMGQLMFFYVLVVSACEVAIFLTIILLFYFKFGCISLNLLRELKWV